MHLQNKLRSTAGYTIDQTILIVAIIAILVTLIIITVGWNLINKASGTKLASQFRQIEDANGQFYASFRTWPHQAYTAPATNGTNNILALAADPAITTWRAQVSGSPEFLGPNGTGTGKNFIPGFRMNAAIGGISHGFGSGGLIQQTPLTSPYGLQGNYLVVRFANVPFSEVQQAERAIDGDTNANYGTGRVVATASGANCLTAAPAGVAVNTAASILVNACYAANLIQ
jgi:hypothetical protein